MAGTRVGRAATAATLVVAVALGACGVLGTWSPPQNEEAKYRERVLRVVPGQDLAVAGVRQVSTFSSAGRHAGQGDFQLGHDVTAGRSWSFTGDIAPTCEEAARGILAAGWTYEYDTWNRCDAVEHDDGNAELHVAPSDHVVVAFTYDCTSVTVRGSLYLVVNRDRVPVRSLIFELTTPYPEEYQGHGAPPAPHLDCVA